MAKYTAVDRDIYLEIFDSFAVDTAEIAEGYFDSNKDKARRVLNKLESAGLIVSTEGSDGGVGTGRDQQGSSRGKYAVKVWQAAESYDNISREEAEQRWDALVGTASTQTTKQAEDYTANELASFKLHSFKLDNALWLSANADTEDARTWWALYYVRMSTEFARKLDVALHPA